MSFPWRLLARNVSLFVIGFVLVASISSDAAGQRSSAKSKEDKSTDSATEPALALTGGSIHTLTARGVVEGDILIRGGKIVAVGKGIEIPKDAKRISVKGMNVTPGLIDVRSSLWLTPAAARESSSSGSLAAVDGIDPFREDWREVAKQGVTTVYVQPGSSGVLGGSGVVLRAAEAASIDELLIAGNAGAQASLGVGGKTTTSRDRYAQYAALKKVLEAAKKYDDEWKKYEDYESKKKAKSGDKKKEADKTPAKDGDKSKTDAKAKPDEKPAAKKDDAEKKVEKPDPKKDAVKKPAASTSKDSEKKAATKKEDEKKDEKPPTKPKRDPAKDFLRLVIQRKTPLRLEAHRQDDVANALKLAKEMNVRIILEGASKPGASQDSLLKSRVPLVLGPFLESSSTPTYRQGREDNWASPLAREDARWAIATFSSEPRGSRLLRTHAALAVASGVKPSLALRALTKDAARILGIEDDAGVIATGKRADIAVFAGQPLDPSAPAVLTISGGEITHQTEADAVAVSADAVKRLPAKLPDAYAIRSQRVLQAGKFTAATVVVRKGKIAGIRGNDGDIKDMPVFDVGSSVITPGLVSAYSELGQASLLEDTTDAVTPDLRVADAFDPTIPAWKEYFAAGYLQIGLSPGAGNVVSGHSAVVRATGDHAEIASSTASLKIVLTSASRNTNRYPASLAGQVALVRSVLQGEIPPTRMQLPKEVERQLMSERSRSIEAARKGKRRVLILASERAEIQAAIDLVEQFELQATLVHPAELEPFIEDLKRLKIGVVAKTVNPNDYDRYLEQVAQAASAGVEVAFGGESPQASRISAALASSLGMPQQAALSSLTDVAARLAGGSKTSGRLAPKQAADFVIWDGSPLDLCRKPINIVVGGQLKKID